MFPVTIRKASAPWLQAIQDANNFQIRSDRNSVSRSFKSFSPSSHVTRGCKHRIKPALCSSRVSALGDALTRFRVAIKASSSKSRSLSPRLPACWIAGIVETGEPWENSQRKWVTSATWRSPDKNSLPKNLAIYMDWLIQWCSSHFECYTSCHKNFSPAESLNSTPLHHMTSHHIASYDITHHTSHHITWHRTTWHEISQPTVLSVLKSPHNQTHDIIPNHTTSHHISSHHGTSHHITTDTPQKHHHQTNGWRLVHKKKLGWGSDWLVAQRTFYRQIFSLADFSPWNFRPGSRTTGMYLPESISSPNYHP